MSSPVLRDFQVSWPFIAGLGLGFLVAFPFAAPLMGGKIPEAAATLWGSAMGAIVAVAGAFWVTKTTQQTQRRNTAELLLAFVMPTIVNLEVLVLRLGTPTQRPDSGTHDQEPDALSAAQWQDIAHTAKIVSREYDLFRDTVHRADNMLNFLGPVELRMFLNLEATLGKLPSAIAALLGNAAAGVMYGAPPSWEQRFQFSGILSSAQGSAHRLRTGVNLSLRPHAWVSTPSYT